MRDEDQRAISAPPRGPNRAGQGSGRQRSRLSRLFAYALAVALSAWAPSASACPVCVGPFAPAPLAQRVANAERVVLAQRDSVHPDRLRAIALIKGGGEVGEVIADPGLGKLAAVERPSTPLMLIRETARSSWTSAGSIGAEHEPLLRRIVQLKPTPELSEAERVERLRFFQGYLGHAEPLLDGAAYDEIARAPYGAMKALRPAIDRGRLWAWLDDPARERPRALYYLLVGIAGGEDDAARIERRLRAAWDHRAADLAALLTAHLELRGEAGIGFIETAYILDRDRTPAELEAVRLALSVHGSEGAPVSRARVIQTYRLLIEHRRPLAGLVAPDLAAWGYWDATPAFIDVLDTADLHPASRFAILNYLKASPRADAQAAWRARAGPRQTP
jgi:hypothetical protein